MTGTVGGRDGDGDGDGRGWDADKIEIFTVLKLQDHLPSENLDALIRPFI